MVNATPPSVLTPEQKAFFLQNGYVKIPGGVPKSNVDKFMDKVFVRLAWDPEDVSTWTQEAVHMPRHREVKHGEHMPKAWAAACEIVGGEDKFDEEHFTTSGDSMIVNGGTEFWETHTQHPKDSGNWHIDGDWFDHYLDSSDQALETICLYTDVVPGGGPTLICPKALPKVVKWLYEHPEGGWTSATCNELVQDIPEEDFVECTGNAGDVFLCHPFLPHSKSRNHKRKFRAICNPTTTLKEPFNFNRPDGKYSLNEQVILNALGVSSLPDWHITGPRTRFQPRTQSGRDALVAQELERLKADAEKNGGEVDSKHLRGEKFEGEVMKRYPPSVPHQPGARGPIINARPITAAVGA